MGDIRNKDTKEHKKQRFELETKKDSLNKALQVENKELSDWQQKKKDCDEKKKSVETQRATQVEKYDRHNARMKQLYTKEEKFKNKLAELQKLEEEVPLSVQRPSSANQEEDGDAVEAWLRSLDE